MLPRLPGVPLWHVTAILALGRVGEMITRFREPGNVKDISAMSYIP